MEEQVKNTLGGGYFLEKPKTSTTRQYGIDALKILSMYMVVILHVLGSGGVLSATGSATHYWLAWSLEGASYCAVNCFALVTGYLMVGRKTNYARFFNLLFQVVFYGLVIGMIFKIVLPQNYRFYDVFINSTPFTSSSWWYARVYLVMFFLIPFFNRLLDTLSRKSTKILVGILLVAFCLRPTIFFKDENFTNFGYNLIWISVLYMVGAYVKKYGFAKNTKKRWFALAYFLSLFIMLGWKALFEAVPQVGAFLDVDLARMFINYTSPTVVVMAVSLLLFFAKLKMPKFLQKPIAFVSSLSFAVYIIHCQNMFHEFFFKGKFVPFASHNAFVMIGLVLLTGIIVFVGCSLVEYLRVLLFKLCRINKLEKKLGLFLDKRINVDKIDNSVNESFSNDVENDVTVIKEEGSNVKGKTLPSLEEKAEDKNKSD